MRPAAARTAESRYELEPMLGLEAAPVNCETEGRVDEGAAPTTDVGAAPLPCAPPTGGGFGWAGEFGVVLDVGTALAVTGVPAARPVGAT